MQGTEQRAGDNRLGVLVSSWTSTLGTRYLLGQAGAHRLVDQHGLHLLQQVLRFVKV
jgi:hypothetical protein